MKYLLNIRTILVYFLIFYINPVTAQFQNLYTPVNIQAAYKNETRAFDGKPGKKYWQNHANYTIDVALYPHKRFLKGTEKITYFNESPDTLKQLVIRLYQDIYKKGNNRSFAIDESVLHDGVIISNLKINGEQIDTEMKNSPAVRRGTNMTITLAKPLLSKQKITLELEWNFVIPNKSQIRSGAYDESTFFVAYWYPQIAVYDDIDGWDTHDYTGQVEMYNDFNNYDVNIQLPEKYTVWATGVLQNPDQLLPEKQLNLYKQAQKSTRIINIISDEDYKSEDFVINPLKNKWHFVAENVPDFAFALSDYYLWDAHKVSIDKEGTSAFVAAAYNPDSKDFYEVAEIAGKVINLLSTEFPAIPYPWPEMTVFNGEKGGGMEFPMMVNDGSSPSRERTIGLTAHEITHTYFPFMMGINERKYAWMDEGMAVMLPIKLQSILTPGYDPLARRLVPYMKMLGTENDLPCMIPSFNLLRSSYRNASYNRSGLAYLFLNDMLGEDTFKKTMQVYADRWHGKHPIPNDFFFTFNDVTKQDLSWFWKPWFYESGYPDLAIEKVELTAGSIEISVIKKGNIPVPLKIKVLFNDGSEEMVYKTVDVWKQSSRTEIKISSDKKPVKITMGDTNIPDAFPEDNEKVF